ncbi:MAG: orotate phosphoribosyltransferase [Lysobacteraceae bacterium]|nr:MAG: orotate phosphoribosyltransferase [Xanthomonadaceae bacterium]
MHDHRRRFLDLAARCEALRFGRFTLKSGRVSPYFFNAGRFTTGAALAELGECYAKTLLDAEIAFDMLFGPAYKGIPLATALAIALARQGRSVPVAFNRKEAKTHGEGGDLMGAELAGRVLVVDDVITAGTAVRESLARIRAAGAEPCGVLIALDRKERGLGPRSAAEELAESEGIPVLAIASLDDLLAYTGSDPRWAEHHLPLQRYRAEYGCSAGPSGSAA